MTAETILREQFVHGEFDELMGYLNNTIEPEIKSAMVKFAQYHVKQALELAGEAVIAKIVDHETGVLWKTYDGHALKNLRLSTEQDIINAYPLTNIK